MVDTVRIVHPETGGTGRVTADAYWKWAEKGYRLFNASDAPKLTPAPEPPADDLITRSELTGYALTGGRVRHIGGYKAPSSACPTSRAAVSVTLNAFDGYDGAGPIRKVQALPDVAECNFVVADLAQYTAAANTFWWSAHTGPWHAGSSTPASSFVKPMDFTTMVEGTYLAVAFTFLAGSWSPDLRIWIDDEEIADWWLGTRAAGALQGKQRINSAALGSGTHIVNINFPKRGTYKVRVAGLLNTVGGASAADTVAGNLLVSNANSRLLKPAPRLNVGVISDSFFEAISTQTTLTPALEIAHQLNANVWNHAQGGSGFCAPSYSGANGDKSFGSTLVFAALARHPRMDLMIVNGTVNDLGYSDTAVAAAMRDLFAKLRAYRRDLPIVWVGLEPQSYFKNIYGLPAIQAREQLQADVAANDPNVVAVIRPAAEEWLTGTGKVGGTAGNGNQDFTIGADGIHPGEYGATYYGKMIAERMKSALSVVKRSL